MKTTVTKFGELNGVPVHLFTLENDKGMVVKISDYGATITSIQVPVRGALREVACGFDTLEGYFSDAYRSNSPYFGCTVGRYCSQIKDAKFLINGKEYQLSANAGNNNLHGGALGYDKRLWSGMAFQDDAYAGVVMTLVSNDMEEGFPGNVKIKVRFRISNENDISISYEATTDKDTPFSLTNHTYFNLTGFDTTVEEHTAQVYSKQRLALDDTGAATGEIINVNGECDDLSEGKNIGEVHSAMGDGFEHFYVFDHVESVHPIAKISSETGKLSLTVHSSEPCMLLYTGKYTSDELKRESGDQFGKYRGFCCETHRYPNGPNIKSPKSILRTGEQFKSNTIFTFSDL